MGGVGGLFVEVFEQQGAETVASFSTEYLYTQALCKVRVESATVISFVRNALGKTSAVTLD